MTDDVIGRINNNDDKESEELQNMQVRNLLQGGNSTLHNGSYTIEFRDMQFSQHMSNRAENTAAPNNLKRNDVKKETSIVRDAKIFYLIRVSKV